MDQLRVVDLAHTMGITSRELIFKLRAIGVSVNSEEDTLDLSTVRAIASSRRWAARAVGARRVTRRGRFPRTIRARAARSRATVVVFPVPGPPEMTVNFLRKAAHTATRCQSTGESGFGKSRRIASRARSGSQSPGTFSTRARMASATRRSCSR
jgi:hypothetical protein